MINFMAEISSRFSNTPQPSPSPRWGRAYNIYELYAGPRPSGTYWETWGGTHDNIETDKIELYYAGWLFPVSTASALLNAQSPAVYTDTVTKYIYISIPAHPWLYPPSDVSASRRDGYLSAPRSSGNPSDLYLDGRLYETRLAVPSISVRLSDPVSGLTKYTAFSFSLDNSDGRFDGEGSHEYFNSPAYIRKTAKDSPAYTDFISIREGSAESITVNSEKMEVQCADKFRALDDPVCRQVRKEDFPIPEDFVWQGEEEEELDEEDSSIPAEYIDGIEEKTLPVIFGQCDVPLIELVETKYEEHEGCLVDDDADDSKEDDTVTLKGLYLAGEYIHSVSGVYGEKDGEDVSIPFTFDYETKIIRVEYEQKMYTLTGVNESGKPVYEKKEKTPKPKWARVQGYTANRIGETVAALTAKNPYLQFNTSVWDTAETSAYNAASPRVNLMITGGDIKKAVADALKNDMAFLIQKSDGRLSLRRWRAGYGGPGGAPREIPSWMITQQPEKSFQQAQEHWFSVCAVKYRYSDHRKTHEAQYLYTDAEAAASGRYLKKAEKTFETRLTSEADAKLLAVRLAARFTELKDTVSLGAGIDTSQFNLLDTVKMRISVNGREYSDSDTWIIRETDPAQDKLVLEERKYHRH